jgi:hypothetical protein
MEKGEKCYNILMRKNLDLKNNEKCSVDFKMRRGTKNQRKVGRKV